MGDLSHGLPALGALGNRIVQRDTAAVIHLRGVNRSGMEYAEPGELGFLHSSGISAQELREIVQTWNCNVIRIPFNQDWVLRGRGGHSVEEYRLALDQIVDWAASFGAYTLLDLQWLDADTIFGRLDDGSANHIAPMPNDETIDLWSILAERYKNEPAVLFDLYNEPHDVRPQDWQQCARKLVDTIRPIHPLSLIWISGTDWANDLRGVQLDLPNLVYSAHVYPNRPARDWKKRWGHLSGKYPVFIGEWGGGMTDLAWGATLSSVMRTKCCGWTAWSWVDHPHLVRDARNCDYTPTAFGELVRAELCGGSLLAQPRLKGF